MRSVRYLLPIVALGAAVYLFTTTAAAETARPSVLLICLDTLRADHLRCMGNDSIRTPHIDALARDGVLFRRCQSTAPWTLPSIASAFMGLVPYRHGAIGGKVAVLDSAHTTLAEYFSAAGYRTASYVTVSYLTERFGTAQGFAGHELVADAVVDGLDQAGQVTRLGTREMGEYAGRESLLLLHYFDVHAPYQPPPPFDRMYYEGNERAPGNEIFDLLISERNRTHWTATRGAKAHTYRWLDGVTDLRFPAAQYAAGVSYADHHVGRVIAKAEELGIYDDLLIVLFADHGEHLGEHSIWFTHYQVYQEALHVPLIIKYPAGRRAGTVIDEPVSTVDLLPTLLAECGLEQPPGLDGRSLEGVVAGRTAAGESLLLSERGEKAGELSKSLVEWPWKLVFLSRGRHEVHLLFHLERDPGEEHDVAADEPEVLQHLRDRLWSLCDAEHPALEVTAERPADLDEETRRRLRALGY